MNMRLPIVVLGLAILVGGTLVWQQRQRPASDAASLPEISEDLPIPPVPPRIAEGADYENCMAMLGSDPAGANNFADAWQATGGGEGAIHCLAMSDIALGDVETGAAMLEKLANDSHASDAARATVYGQADQAWSVAGDPDRAYGAATLAL